MIHLRVPMRIAIVASMRPNNISGFSSSVLRLAAATSQYMETVVVTSATKQSSYDMQDVHVNSFDQFDASDYDCVVLTGCFDPRIWLAAKKCHGRNIPYIVSPRSNLTRKSWRKSWAKKWLCSPYIFGMYLNNSAAIHFLANEEAAHSWMIGVRASFVCPDVHSIDPPIDGGSERRRVIGFLGRLDVHHKGLDLLLRAFAQGAKQLRALGYRVELVGPDHRGSLNWITSTCRSLEIDDLVDLLRPINGLDKQKWLSSVDIFVHTSRYEGQPLAMFEAIGAGAYPVVTKFCNMGDFIDRLGYGQVSGISVDSITNAILSAAQRKGDVDSAQAASALEKYTPDFIGREFCDHIQRIVLEG